MTKQTNYELLKDVYNIVSRLESKLNHRIDSIDSRVDNVQEFINNIKGKIAVIAMIASALATLFIDYIRRRL